MSGPAGTQSSQVTPGDRWLPPPVPRIQVATDLANVAVLKHGNTYLLADARGDIQPDHRGLGLYDLDTRILSCATLRLNGLRPTLLSTETAGNHHATIELTNPDDPRDSVEVIGGAVERQTLSIRRHRWIGNGLGERISIANYAAREESVTLDLILDADAADIFEIRGHPRPKRGRFLPTAATARSLAFAYVGLDGLVRRTNLAFTPAEVSAVERPGSGPAANPPGADDRASIGSVRVRWVLNIPSGASADVDWRAWATLERVGTESSVEALNSTPTVSVDATPVVQPEEAMAQYRAWTARATSVTSDSESLDLVIRRSLDDLLLLVNDGPNPGRRYIAAGVPWYATLFGRDAIITAFEALAFLPDLAVDTLRVLAAWQATEVDASRDMAPGKILHELRTGEMARTGEILHRPYYGAVDPTPLWLVLLGETTRWTGDLDLVRELWPNVLAALGWIDDHGDPDRDGFVEYERGSAEGAPNHGWKDSTDGIRNADGSVARPPIALVEVQGYVHDAKVRVADLARRIGEADLAGRLDAEARELKRRFDGAFWMPAAGFYAVALDADKRQVGSITSNPAHGLWSGIVPDDRVEAVARRLAADDLDSGWGLRTLASGQAGFNPIGYHTGSVWPHDNAIAAAGLKRAGRHEDANRIASRIFEAARRSPDHRLPELFCGFSRDEASAPVPYPVACSPQAWSAAAPLSLLQTMLGMRANAFEHVLELDHPRLPDWLGSVTVRNLRVGSATVDFVVQRHLGATTGEVIRTDGDVEVVVRTGPD